MTEQTTPSIGDNNPPEPINTAFEAIQIDINDLRDQMSDWLDGQPIENQAQCNDLARLIDKMRKAKKAAEDAKGDEKRPHLDANIAIEARYKPLVNKAELAVKTALGVQSKFLVEQDRIQREIAEKAAKEAREAAEAAAKAARDAIAEGNLSKREDAETQIEAAGALLAEAKMLDRLKANAKGEDMTRAVGLVEKWSATMTDPTAALRHYWKHPNPDYRRQIEALAQSFADKDVRGGARAIEGFTISMKKVAR